jgi:hypothetical protein
VREEDASVGDRERSPLMDMELDERVVFLQVCGKGRGGGGKRVTLIHFYTLLYTPVRMTGNGSDLAHYRHFPTGAFADFIPSRSPS